jgi:hypothetical protein
MRGEVKDSGSVAALPNLAVCRTCENCRLPPGGPYGYDLVVWFFLNAAACCRRLSLPPSNRWLTRATQRDQSSTGLGLGPMRLFL